MLIKAFYLVKIYKYRFNYSFSYNFEKINKTIAKLKDINVVIRALLKNKIYKQFKASSMLQMLFIKILIKVFVGNMFELNQ